MPACKKATTPSAEANRCPAASLFNAAHHVKNRDAHRPSHGQSRTECSVGCTECCNETARSKDTAPDGMGGARQYTAEQRGTCSPLVIHTQVYALRHNTGKGPRALWQLMIPTSMEPYHHVPVCCERAQEIAWKHERQALAHFHKLGSKKRIQHIGILWGNLCPCHLQIQGLSGLIGAPTGTVAASVKASQVFRAVGAPASAVFW
jgi:hypothetical protein